MSRKKIETILSRVQVAYLKDGKMQYMYIYCEQGFEEDLARILKLQKVDAINKKEGTE